MYNCCWRREEVVGRRVTDVCRSRGRHRTYLSGNTNGSTGKCSAGRALDRKDSIIPVLKEA